MDHNLEFVIVQFHVPIHIENFLSFLKNPRVERSLSCHIALSPESEVQPMTIPRVMGDGRWTIWVKSATYQGEGGYFWTLYMVVKIKYSDLLHEFKISVFTFDDWTCEKKMRIHVFSRIFSETFSNDLRPFECFMHVVTPYREPL